ncbi:MAG: HlyD family efflux transporter periplasmic adaptor subunit [Nitratireductor sp.]|nr:HlyD family efflux transporter periplasmic adaptor subunit [Nitratireductor sp.]
MEWVCMLPVIAGLFSACGPGEPLAVGYAEGEYVLLAPIETARLVSVELRKGDRITTGAVVATLERRDAEIAVAEAEAAMRNAAAVLDNLKSGKRPEEIAVIEASLNSANAQAKEAERAFERQKGLSRGGFASQANMDSAQTQVELTAAKVAELEANLAVARLPARAAEIEAAESSLKRASASLENAQWRLSQRTVLAPADGEVADVILRKGELAGPQSPVVSFLPDGAIKLKLYVPEPYLSAMEIGRKLKVNCDGCRPGSLATISYVSSEPEFTPPVIYSINNRQKLVYLVEAKPDTDAQRLRPGQIVDVDLQSGDVK